ncbi:hypothetical protein HWI79_3018 [Cryptosporidium felis]|nr:hypothetical protein HWI79_3018 [Cryptosporidium felis]
MILSLRWILLSLLVAIDIYCQSALLGCYAENGLFPNDSFNSQALKTSRNVVECPPNHPYMRSIFQIDLIKKTLDLENFGRSLYLTFESSREVRYFLMTSAGMFAVAERIMMVFLIFLIFIRLFVTPILKTLSTIILIFVILRIIFAIYNFSENMKIYDATILFWNSIQTVFFLIDDKIYNYGENLLRYMGFDANETLAS